MKYVIVLLISCLYSFPSIAQINGNGKEKTVTIPVQNLKNIDVQFNANITLDYNLKEEVVITCDENIIPFIGQDFKNGKLTLDQIKWIEPSRMPTIVIGTPFLESVFQGTHSSTTIKNINAAKITLEGNVGNIIADGKVVNASIITTGTEMDLSNLDIKNAYVSIDDDSKITLDKVKKLQTDLDEKARLILKSPVENYEETLAESNSKKGGVNPNLKWIEFSIKNNSWKRNHFVVQGPKKDGSYFSYGFSLFPGSSKDEKWSVGTKVYKETRAGGRELLVTIASEDEGKVVKLFN